MATCATLVLTALRPGLAVSLVIFSAAAAAGSSARGQHRLRGQGARRATGPGVRHREHGRRRRPGGRVRGGRRRRGGGDPGIRRRRGRRNRRGGGLRPDPQLAARDLAATAWTWLCGARRTRSPAIGRALQAVLWGRAPRRAAEFGLGRRPWAGAPPRTCGRSVPSVPSHRRAGSAARSPGWACGTRRCVTPAPAHGQRVLVQLGTAGSTAGSAAPSN